jgi:uncharacterized protein DUF6098
MIHIDATTERVEASRGTGSRGARPVHPVLQGPDEDRKNGGSVDYESGLRLPGFSANPLDPERWWTRPLRDWLARQLCQYAHIKDSADDGRVAWILKGDVAGRGPDNEPLIDPSSR